MRRTPTTAATAALERTVLVIVLATTTATPAFPADRPAATTDAIAQRAEGRKLFIGGASPACAVCHTLDDAGATGAVGPVLDELKPDAARVATAVRTGVGLMPPYRASLSETQIQALAAYVAAASRAAR